MRIPPYGAALVLLVAAALALRLWGTSYGLPLLVNNDEMPIASHAVDMLARGDPNPGFFHYPSLYLYMQAGLDAAMYGVGRATGDMAAVSDLSGRGMIRAGRVMTAVLGALTVLATYLAGRALLGRGEGLAAAALVAASPLHVAHSFRLGVDVPTGLFCALALWAAARRLRGPSRWRDHLGGAVFAGLATGTKYTAFPALLPLLVAHVVAREPADGGPMRRARDPRLWAAVVALPVVFLATTPYALLDFSRFHDEVSWEGRHYATGHPGAEAEGASYGHYLHLLADDLGPEGLLLLVVGTGALAWSDRRALAVLAAFPLLYIAFVGRFPVYFPRNLAPVVPFAALLAGAGLAAPIRAAARRAPGTRGRALAIGLAALVAVVGAVGLARHAARAVDHVRTVTLPDTRLAVMHWVSRHVPPGARILREPYTPEVELIGAGGHPRYRVTALTWTVADVDPGALWLFDYVVLSDAMYGRFLKDPARYPDQAARYRALFHDLTLAYESAPEAGRTTGPLIRVYRVPKGPRPEGPAPAPGP